MSEPSERASTPGAAAAASARFARRLAARRRSRWIRVGAVVTALAVVLAGGWAVLFSGAFAVRSVQVAGVQLLDAERVERVASVPHGQSLALLDTSSIAERVRELAPVADVSVSRRFPSTVRIKVTERTPVAVLKTPGARRLVDAEGIVFAKAGKDSAELVQVATTREALAPEILVGVQTMLAALPDQLRTDVRRVDVDGAEQMSVLLTDGRRVVWGGPDRSEFKARVLGVLATDKATREATAYDVSVPESPVVRRR